MESIRCTRCTKHWLTSRCQNVVICGKIPMAACEEISQMTMSGKVWKKYEMQTLITR